jgi:dihydrofolate synthase / folylpolyglutamate synthase
MFDAQSLAEWIRHIEILHSKPIDLGLERMREMIRRMGISFAGRTFITVGGTNGKGSTCAMLESIYRAAGYTTGMHTSPHLLRLNERCRVNGREVSDERLIAAFREVEKARGDMTLSYFEYTALAFLRIFQEEGVEAVICEIGLGGRLDAINAVDADASIIATVGIDHVAFLGGTREKIGWEKAHIYRPGRPAICADPDVPVTVSDYVKEIGAKRLFAGIDWKVTEHADTTFDFEMGGRVLKNLPEPALYGENQYRNAGGVLAAVMSLQDRLPVTQEAIAKGLTSVRLCARFEKICDEPAPTVIDVGHNPQAAKVLRENMDRSRRPGEITLAVFGMLRDKDMTGVSRILGGGADEWFVASLTGPRAATAEQLSACMLDAGIDPAAIRRFADVKAALLAAQERARALLSRGTAVRIMIFGSFVTVTAALEALSEQGVRVG